MAVSYVSDLSGEAILEQEVVTLTVARQGETRVVHMSEDELGTMMEEDDAFASLILMDD